MNEKIIVNGYELDEQQLASVIENKKYSLIIAGAGSGKTLTLIGKIKYLLDNSILKPDEICCISFTNEATNNLRESIFKNCNVELSVFTFHKLALTILKDSDIQYNIAASDLLSYIIDEFFFSKCFGNILLQNMVYKIFRIYFFKSTKKWEDIVNSRELVNLKKTIMTFINLMKGNGYSIESFESFFKNRRFRKVLCLIYAIYVIYELEKVSSGLIDFDDMMSYATNIVRRNIIRLPFKMFIIDEFQDTSLLRFNLIRELVMLNDAGLCVVGDDYQSIYHFSGCDLEIFLNFKDYYNEAKIYRLEKTYRNSLELVNTAGKFVMKNPNQIKKNLVSPKKLDKPINLVYFNNIDSVLERVIEDIPKDKEILIISRNNFDIKKYTKCLGYEIRDNNYIEFIKFKDRKIRFLSIHSSKGLESDVVIILNVSNDLYGLPIKLKDEKVLSLVKKNQPYPYEEERRLFYVALTRTKSYIYLLVPSSKPSIFASEIKHDENVKVYNFN